MTVDAVITYTDEETGIQFRWHGGAYIDVGYGVGLDFYADDLINVWDDAKDCSRFEVAADIMAVGRPFRRVLEYFEETCREYLDIPREGN